MDLKEAMTSPLFDPEKAAKLTPDNKYATSEIKDAYMRARYGAKMGQSGDRGTLLVKETFMKQYLSDENWQEAINMSKDNGAMEGKSKGDMIMRHCFSAAGITLRDEYIDYDDYPFASFRFEPGPLYQVPFIERFIPQNKSLDVIVTRLEKWVNAMVVGVYQKRKGENFQISNFPGGQVMEYETTPLAQMGIASPGNAPFNVVEMLNKFIDEQGATTAGGINVPQGVKSGIAIESVKATEYANLKISTLMLKDTVKTIAKLMMERAHKDLMEPSEVESLQDGEPDYFDVIGQTGYDLSQKVNKSLPQDVVVINKNTKVRIEIEPGLGLTPDGKKEAMKSIIDYMLQVMQLGLLPQEAMKQVIKRFLEEFGYGSTQELMEAMEAAEGLGQMTESTIKQIQIAVLQTLKDAGIVGPELEEKLTMSTQVGTLQALKDSGVIDSLSTPKATPAKPLTETLSISFKDLPEDTKAEVIQMIGLPRPTAPSPAFSDQKQKESQVVKNITPSTGQEGVLTS
jgi:hypothetical protein